jgi:hypothetical protein
MADNAMALDFDLALTRQMVAREREESDQWIEHAGPLGLLLALMTHR